VVPVLSEDGAVEYYLPAGRWTHLITGEVQDGGRWYRAQHGFLSLPLFVRPGTVLALGAQEDRPDYDYSAGVTFRVYELADGATASCHVPTTKGTDGAICTVRRSGSQVDVAVTGVVPSSWNVQIIGAKSVSVSSPARSVADPLGMIVTAPERANVLRLQLPAS
jgi:alpha-D-xyloside xylohydrolase